MSIQTVRQRDRPLKRQQLSHKLKAKADQQLKYCYKLITKNEWCDTIRTLTRLVKTKNIVQVNQFRWLGHTETWRYHFPAGGPLGWFMDKSRSQKMQAYHIFDLINILYMIQFYTNKMSFNEVMDQYSQIQKTFPKRIELIFGQANIYYERRQYTQAQEMYKQIQRKQPNGVIYQCLAWTYYQLGNKEKAMGYCQKSLVMESNPHTRFLEIILNQDANWVIRWLKKLANQYSLYFKIYLELAQRTTNDRKQCLQYFEQALSYDIQSGQINGKLALFYLKQANHQKTFEYSERALSASDRKSSWGFYMLAKMHIADKQYKQAIEQLENALRLEHYCVEYNYELGKLYEQHGRDEKALENYRLCIENSPYEPKYELRMGEVYSKMEDYKRAKKHIGRALKLKKDYVEALLLWAKIEQIWDKNFQKAYDLYTIAKHFQPDNPQITLLLVLLLNKKGEYQLSKEKAMKCYNQQLVQSEDKSLIKRCVTFIIMIEIRNRNFVEAVKWILRLPQRSDFQGKDVVKPYVDAVVKEAGMEAAKKAVVKIMGLEDRSVTKMGRKIMNRICKLLDIQYFKGPIVVELDPVEKYTCKEERLISNEQQQKSSQQHPKIEVNSLEHQEEYNSQPTLHNDEELLRAFEMYLRDDDEVKLEADNKRYLQQQDEKIIDKNNSQFVENVEIVSAVEAIETYLKTTEVKLEAQQVEVAEVQKEQPTNIESKLQIRSLINDEDILSAVKEVEAHLRNTEVKLEVDNSEVEKEERDTQNVKNEQKSDGQNNRQEDIESVVQLIEIYLKNLMKSEDDPNKKNDE